MRTRAPLGSGPMRRPSPVPLRVPAVVVALSVGLIPGLATSACSTRDRVADPCSIATRSGDAPTTTTTGGVGEGEGASADAGTPTITWGPVSSGVQLGTLRVPIDDRDPSIGSFTLRLARHLATDSAARIGTLLVNPGGPGVGGSDYAICADRVYSDDLRARFDIVGWDPRGTGKSEPAIDCVDDYDRYDSLWDGTPDDDAERQQNIDLAKEFQGACATKNAAIIRHIGTNDSARDMDAIRRALGEATISYFGFSYGTELGATWATMFPDTVRAIALDGAVDPTADLKTQGLQQIAGFERSLDAFLAQCSRDDECAFHNDGDAEGAFDQLMQRLDDEPVPSAPGRPAVNPGMARTAISQAMYQRALWDRLAVALDRAQRGDGRGLLALYDAYLQRRPDGTYDNSLEAFQTILCMDDPARPTVAEEDADAAMYRSAAPRMSPSTVGSYFCSFYPTTIDPRIEITGKGAGPILVVGTTGDPATPLGGAATMARSLEQGVLLTVEGDNHTSYRHSSCARRAIDAALIERTMPAAGTRCDS